MLMNMADKFKRGDSLSGLYRGIVFENFDPKGLGRCKIFVEGRLVAKAEDLPWSFPKAPTDGGASPSSSIPKVPEIGSIVIVEFPFEDIYFPVYSGKWLSTNTQALGFLENYSELSDTTDGEGNGTTINKAKQTMEVSHTSGSKLEFQKNGSALVSSKKRVCLELENGEASVDLDAATGAATLTGQSNVNLSAPSTIINSDNHSVNAGNLKNNISGSEESEIVGGRSVSVGGSESKVVGSHLSEIVSGNKSTTTVGSTDETLGQGRTTDVILGDLEEKLLAGDRKVKVTLGNIDFKTLAGKVEIANLIGGLSVNEAGQINIKGLGGELLDLIIQMLDEMIAENTDISTMVVNTVVGPSSPPVNSSLFIARAAKLTAIKVLLTAMKA